MSKNNNWIREDFKMREEKIKEIYFNIISSEYWKELLFKWWTSLSLFYWLQRFSEDLDFNLIDTWKMKIVVNWIYKDLKSKWYKLSKIYRDWTNVVHIDLFYKIWNNEYVCQLEFFKNNYWINQNFEIKYFYWKCAKLLDISENFAHKCCAYLERWNRKIERSWKPKWRDLFDIMFYLHKNVQVNMNIIRIRTKIDTKEWLFLEILKTLLIKHKKFHKEFLDEINNFWYSVNYNQFEEFINMFFSIVNTRILNQKFNFNFEYLKHLKENWMAIISSWISFITKEQNWFFKITNKLYKKEYKTKKIEFIEKYVEENFNELTFKN